jgi:hypothetical protein
MLYQRLAASNARFSTRPTCTAHNVRMGYRSAMAPHGFPLEECANVPHNACFRTVNLLKVDLRHPYLNGARTD